jgi:hypothetical protein
MRFLITYAAAGLPKSEHPLSASDVEHHVSLLDSELRRDIAIAGHQVEVLATLAGASSKAEVSFPVANDREAQKSALADALRRINLRVSGLCFVAEQMS